MQFFPEQFVQILKGGGGGGGGGIAFRCFVEHKTLGLLSRI